jgi:hypothetical protein
MKDCAELLKRLQDITARIRQLSEQPEKHELDPDAVADLNLSLQAIDRLVNRVERLVN